MPPSPRRIKSRFPKPFPRHVPDGVTRGLLRDWVKLGDAGSPVFPGIYELRERTRKVLGE